MSEDTRDRTSDAERRIATSVHLAEPAETGGLRGPKKRAKGDRADARHLRELLMVKRLPESWIPPVHILDLRALVRLRHTLSEQRSEWQQRIQARFPNSPDREYDRPFGLRAAERLGGNRACLALARKLLKRCYHTLRGLGEDALAPPTDQSGSAAARRAAVLPRPTAQQPVSLRMPWPLDPGFGSAMWQRAPVSRPAHPDNYLPTKQIVRARQALFTPMRRGRLPNFRC
jgi:hypothetical protein